MQFETTHYFKKMAKPITHRLEIVFLLISACFFQVQGDISDKIVYDQQELFYLRHNGADVYEAREQCFLYGGDLIIIDIEEKQAFINTWYDGAYGDFWLGMRKDSQGKFRWLGGSSLSYSNWKEDEKLDNDLHQCASQLAGEKTWVTGNCGGISNPLIMCERMENTSEPVVLPPDDPLGCCPQGFVGIDGEKKCYKVNIRTAETGVDWYEAKEICQEERGSKPDLASFHDFKETALVSTQLPGSPISLWIGLTLDQGTDRYIWSDNSQRSFDNWAEGEPKAFSLTPACADLEVEPGPPGSWRANPCDIRRGFICQVERSAENLITVPPPTPPHNCDPGYLPLGQSCFKLVAEMLNWDQANDKCKSEGAFLATVHGHEDNAMVQLATADYENVWIGLRDAESDREFHWTDGWPVHYTNWANSQPSSTNNHDCVTVDQEGRWSATNCQDIMPFICKTTQETAPSSPPAGEGQCPGIMPGSQPWVEQGEYCFYQKTSSSGSTWLEAMMECMQLHADASLVSIHHLATNTFIRDMFSSSFDNDIWIGMHLTKDATPTFAWIDGSPVQFTNWQANHPDPSADPDSSCVSMAVKSSDSSFQGTWKEEQCNSKKNFVCSMKKIAPPVIPAPSEGACPSAWDHYGDKCLYIAPDNSTNWYRATNLCQEMAGPKATLASVEDENMNTVIRDALHDRSSTMHHQTFWLGGRSDGDQPTWADGSEFDFEKWEDNEPKVPTDDFACMEMHTYNGFWAMSDCHGMKGFACSVRKVDIPQEEEDKRPGSGGLNNSQSIGIAYGVILAFGITASLVVFFILYKRVEQWKDLNAMNYRNEEDSSGAEKNGGLSNHAVNYKTDSESVQIP